MTPGEWADAVTDERRQPSVGRGRRPLKRLLALLAAASVLILLGACTEKPQTNAQGVKHDAAPWSGTGSAANTGTTFTAAGFKPGEKAAWEAQLKTRALGQNEYNRED